MSKKYKIDRYVYRDHNRYYIQQGTTVYARFNNPTEAIQYKDKLIQQGIIKIKKPGRDVHDNEDRYIWQVKSTGHYRIQKRVNGKQENFGTFRSLENARMERDYMESIDWDYSNME